MCIFLTSLVFALALEPAGAEPSEPDLVALAAEHCVSALANLERFATRGNVPPTPISTEACERAVIERLRSEDLEALVCLACAGDRDAWIACSQPDGSLFRDRRMSALRVVAMLDGVAPHLLGPGKGQGNPMLEGLGSLSRDVSHQGFGERHGVFGPAVRTGDPVVLGPLSVEEVGLVAHRGLRSVRRCYGEALAGGRDLEGVLELKFVVQADGRVASVVIRTSTLEHPELETCVADHFAQLRFPEPREGGLAIILYPLSFSPE